MWPFAPAGGVVSYRRFSQNSTIIAKSGAAHTPTAFTVHFFVAFSNGKTRGKSLIIVFIRFIVALHAAIYG